MSDGAPDWLSEEARAVWASLPAEVQAGADRDALVVYCCAVADYAKAQQLLDQTGTVIQGARGGLVRSPLNMVKATNAATIVALRRQLGLGEAPEPQPARTYRNAAATERTLAALRRGGRLEEVDAATAALARHLAGALDRLDPTRNPAQVASLARAHLGALRMLRGEQDDQQPAGGIEDLLAILSSPVGDTT